jgi:glycosyltransferase involved in cell wall biosynthesis
MNRNNPLTEYGEYINIVNINKAKQHSYNKFVFYNKKLRTILQTIKQSKNILLTIADSIIPPNGGGEEWLLSINKFFSKEVSCVAICFKDILNNVQFNDFDYKIIFNIHVIKMPFSLKNIAETINFIKPYSIIHQGFNRLTYMKLANVNNINFVTGFCFWNDFIKNKKSNIKGKQTYVKKRNTLEDIMNINMENKKYDIHENFDIIKENSNYYFASNFMNKISLNNHNELHPVIDTINTSIDLKKINSHDRKYVSLLNVNPLKGGYVLLYLLEHLPHNIPLLGIITEKTDNNFEEELKAAFDKRNKIRNINILYTEKQSDVSSIINKTNVMIIPSLVDETFCRVAYESKIYGLNIVSYCNGNLKYMLGNYEKNIFIDNPLIKSKYASLNEIPDDHYEEWLDKVVLLYNNKNCINDSKETLIKKYNIDLYNTKNKLLELIHSKKKYEKETIGIYGPFCDQGLGIQMREYYCMLDKMGYSCAVFSHKPYIAIQQTKKEWDFENIYLSKNLREDTTQSELLEFVWKYKIKYMIIPEIVCKHIFDTIYFLKLLDVKIITPINIEIMRYIDISMYHLIDVIVANNISSYKILKNIFPYKSIHLLEFNNIYMPRKLIQPNDIITNKKIVFSTYGGLNSIHRKNIINTFKVFNFFAENVYNNNFLDFKLNIHIQGNIEFGNIKLCDEIYNTENINIIVENKPYFEIIKSIQKSDIIIHLGDHEGLGLGFFEALNNNKPVITLDTYPNNEIIKNNVNGFLINCSFTDLTDNNYGVIRKAVVNNNNYAKLLVFILNKKNVKMIQQLFNNNKLVKNNYYNSFKSLI